MKTKIIFSVVCIIYALLIFTNTRYFSPFDDTGFLAADDAGRWYGFELISGGRFFPLHGAELHLFRKFFPDRIGFLTITYGFSALTFLLCGYFLYPFFKRIKSSTIKWLFGIFLVILIFSPAMTAPFFRVLYAERYLLLLFLIISNLFFFKKRNISWTIQLTIVGMVAILLKETAAVTMTVLGISLVIFSKNNYEKIAGAIITFIGIIFFSLYVFFVIPRIQDLYQSADAGFIPSFIFAVKAIIEWSISDPSIIIICGLTVLSILYFFFRNKKVILTPTVVISTLAIVYIGALLGTNIGYAAHYATPIYGFILPLFIVFLTREELSSFRVKIILPITVIFLQLGNVLPGIYLISLERFTNKTLFSLVRRLKENPPRRLYVYTGADWGNHYASGLSYFLIQEKIFVPVLTNEIGRGNEIKIDQYIGPLTIDQFFKKFFFSQKKHVERIPCFYTAVPPDLEKGDQVIITGFSKKEIRSSAEKKYSRFNSITMKQKYFLPVFNTKDLFRYVVLKTSFKKYMRNTSSGLPDHKVAHYCRDNS